MNRTQKVSWAFIVTISGSIVASIIAFVIFYARIGLPGAWKGFAFMGLSGLGALSMLIFRKDPGPVKSDERDKAIHKHAALAGFAMSYLFVGLACMIPFYMLGPDATISVRHLPNIFIGAMVTHFFFYSVTCLLGYGKESKINE